MRFSTLLPAGWQAEVLPGSVTLSWRARLAPRQATLLPIGPEVAPSPPLAARMARSQAAEVLRNPARRPGGVVPAP